MSLGAQIKEKEIETDYCDNHSLSEFIEYMNLHLMISWFDEIGIVLYALMSGIEKQKYSVLEINNNTLMFNKKTGFWVEGEYTIKQQLYAVFVAVNHLKEKGYRNDLGASVGGGVDEVTHTGYISFSKKYSSFSKCSKELVRDFSEAEEYNYNSTGGWASTTNYNSLEVTLDNPGYDTAKIWCSASELTIQSKNANYYASDIKEIIERFNYT